jgi:hypothetical protein
LRLYERLALGDLFTPVQLFGPARERRGDAGRVPRRPRPARRAHSAAHAIHAAFHPDLGVEIGLVGKRRRSRLL